MGIFNTLKSQVTKPHEEVSSQISESAGRISRTIRAATDPSYKRLQHQRQQQMRADYSYVMRYWGFERSDIPNIKKGLSIEVTIWTAITTLGLVCSGAGINMGITYLFCGLCLFIIGLVPTLTALWRLSILRKERYISFSAWLLGRPNKGGDL